MDGATNYTPIFPTLSNGNPTLPQLPGASQQSGQLRAQTHEIPTEPSSTHAFSDSGNFNSDYLHSIVYSIHIVTDNYSTAQTSYVRPEDSSSEPADRGTDEVAEVTQLVNSPYSSDHTPVLGARAWESTAGRSSSATFPSQYSHNFTT